MAFGAHLTPPGFTQGEWQQVLSAEEYYLSIPANNYTKRVTPFLSSNETVCLNLLRRWQPLSDVFCQVQLIRLVEIDMAALYREWSQGGGDPLDAPDEWDFFNEIRLLSVDFLLCKYPGTPTVAIELDGPEHAFDRETARKRLAITCKHAHATHAQKAVIDRVRLWGRDRIKAASLAGASLPLIRVKNSDLYTNLSLSAFEAEVAKHFA